MCDKDFKFNYYLSSHLKKHHVHYMKIHLNAFCVTGTSNGYGNVKIHLETHTGGDYINKGTD